MADDEQAAALERKRKRLEAWRKRQEEKAKAASESEPSKPKVTLSLGGKTNIKKKIKTNFTGGVRFDDADEKDSKEEGTPPNVLELISLEEPPSVNDKKKDQTSSPMKKRRRWGATSKVSEERKSEPVVEEDDDLDKFMESLNSGAMGTIETQTKQDILSTDLNGGAMRSTFKTQHGAGTVSGGIITPEELANLMNVKEKSKPSRKEDEVHNGPSDLEASVSEAATDDEEEERERRNFLQHLKKTQLVSSEFDEPHHPPQLAAEVQSEKQRREKHIQALKKEAEEAKRATEKASQPSIGRIYYSDVESGIMEEAERALNVVNAASMDALEVLAELNKKKELKAVDHSKVEYIPIRKNLYIVPRSLASLTSDEVMERRAKLKIRVRGKGSPAPVESFEQCGLSERILQILRKMQIETPFPVQAQCLPCIMAGRDVIGIAKTGSGKTLAYLLPMLRHIGDQPPLEINESGPIGLVLAPARELAVQIHHVTKVFAKQLGLKSTAVYGGAGVAEQIADLKRGTHIVVATPGRMIDILTMQSGKILSLQRVSYVVMDEADRMFDMGFAPQISAILSAVRPDRQTVLFSATFPKTVEALARKSLKYPIEVLVGGRSVASDSVKQYAELVEEEDKFLRLLQILGEQVDGENKVIVFVDTQSRADSVFEQLIRCGYPSLSLHGGKEQEDRDSTISDFKRSDGPNVLVATSVAGRGLDVPSCRCVINYSAPNHLEDYVHRVGRTGRAGKEGVSYTFCNSGDEEKYAPIVVRAMIEAGHADNISNDLRKVSDEFKLKVEKGEARYAGSGFHGKGYSYDSSELSDAQKLAREEKRQALIEAGMLDPDDDDTGMGIGGDAYEFFEDTDKQVGASEENKSVETTSNLAGVSVGKISADLLALPGMKEAIMKKAGYEIPDTSVKTSSGDHFMEEIEINDYPREARWKVTQKDTTSRLQDEFQIAVTLKGKYYDSKTQPPEGERKLYLHVEATSQRILQTGMQEIRRLLNEETLRV
eukprot:CAMPEP_0176487354 /NCGR_PEP_ID=MMETSP0200_2-20121128/6082_1 /TAXON_ID=947934 /ORGANISM="Chaetoceros sp., Strain GSL56" /LENGTH=1000 /DNA_ID=CAMNT_0017884167 /DNA_START=71 /DNA_END=3070 /DNA_ORIENTATION=-